MAAGDSPAAHEDIDMFARMAYNNACVVLLCTHSRTDSELLRSLKAMKAFWPSVAQELFAAAAALFGMLPPAREAGHSLNAISALGMGAGVAVEQLLVCPEAGRL